MSKTKFPFAYVFSSQNNETRVLMLVFEKCIWKLSRASPNSFSINLGIKSMHLEMILD